MNCYGTTAFSLYEMDKGDQVVASEYSDVDEEESFFQDVDVLQEHGINVADIKKLKSSGICTIKGIQMCTRKKLCGIKGFSEAKVDKIKEACCKIGTGMGFLTALEVSDRRKYVFRVSTGSQELDKLLGGGVESMAITEAFGEFRTGKTQLCHTLCVSAQMPGANGYCGGKVIFIDTEHTFRPDRLRPIADRFNLDQNAVLDNILYARAYTSEHQYELMDYVAAKFHEEPGVFKLLADPKKPIGGNILAHASTTRLALRKGRGETRIAKIYDSPELPENEATFAITSGGIIDAKD
ncbi:meiotic recombination protein DMC1/LIM15 homolog isoform X3 [Schistocerca cancellata]|uniref:meiotic recombination protein DMC1/LIM15 homolog isoform X3 n=1 Tax=Schistocerca cancellata TaxID=274614 RepID=UPI0021190C7F|nr:meiotic recombination protein DMC1/LIM15 homolog isoform X3 [Schistocerca cancellata]